jgi:hypothetical protein
MSFESELANQFVKKYPNQFTTDKWFWEKEVESLLTNYKEMIKIKAKRIFESDLDWDKKYDLIFSDDISKRVYHLFDWYDPDTSYEEDVTYFMRAFEEYIDEQKKLNKILNEEE